MRKRFSGQQFNRRYKGGRRQGKAPIELLTGEALQSDWVDLVIQHKREASAHASGASSPMREFVPSRHGQTPLPEMPPDPAICRSSVATDPSPQSTVGVAASLTSFQLESARIEDVIAERLSCVSVSPYQ